MRILKWLAALGVVLLAAGCAHPVSMSPDIAKLDAPAGATRIEKNVGYVIPDQLRELQVTTPGGGGDKITYKPYADTETAFYKVFSNVFANVTRMKEVDDSATVQSRSLSYVIVPKLKTDSSSTGVMLWPATDFVVDLSYEIRDPDGSIVARRAVTGKGHAERAEFMNDLSLSSRRATADALLKMQDELLNMPELR